MTFTERYERYRIAAEQALTEAAKDTLTEPFEDVPRVARAAQYSLLGGGKRVRAVLCLAVSEMLCGSAELAARYAAAVEMLHCYSLIHDDLPCMDDDDLRRGKPSCHKKFDEATALLAGDALLTAAFETLSTAPGTPAQNTRAVQILSRAAGARGMILGQELDLYYETTPATKQQLHQIHRNKTGQLINAAVQLGAASAEGFREDRERLSRYAFDLGLAFQVMDDVLDVTATAGELGKSVGSDAESHKTTFVSLLGVEESRAYAKELTDRACNVLTEDFGEKAEFLTELAQTLAVRKK